MSAENQGTPTTPSTPVDSGPVEIVFETQLASKIETTDKVDVTDVVPEVRESITETKDDSEVDEQVTNRDEKGRFKPGVQNRIDELTRARREAEREAEYWKARVTGTVSAQPPAQTAAKTKPPVLSDYQTQEEYIDAFTDYKVDQKLELKENHQKQVREVAEQADSWQSRLQEARTSIPDFDKVMDSAEIPVAAHVADLLFEHDLGANLAHHFALNPDVLIKLNILSATKAAFEIGRIADKLEVTALAAGAAKPDLKVMEKQVSKAPPPARTIGQGRATSPSIEEMSMEDYVAQRNERKYGRR